MMLPNIKYLTDESGERTAVVIDIKDWKNLQEELEQLRQQEELRGQIERSLLEVGLWKQGKKDLMSIEEFMKNEC